MCNNNIPNMMYPMIPNMMFPNMSNMTMPNNYTDIDINSHNQNNELTTRINAIERQLRRLEQRIIRLENNNNNSQDYDNSMYMM